MLLLYDNVHVILGTIDGKHKYTYVYDACTIMHTMLYMCAQYTSTIRAPIQLS